MSGDAHEPDSGAAESDSGAVEPDFATAESDSAAVELDSGAAEPASGTVEPGSATAELNSGGDGSVGGRPELSLAYASEPLSLDRFDVKHRERGRVLGVECEVVVIGSSHYVAVPELDVYELLSCRDLEQGRAATIPLDGDAAHSVAYGSDSAVVDTEVEARPLSAFPGPEAADVAYRFGPDAYTTVDCRDDGYETYHTYPEHDLALYTRSTFQRRAPDERAVHTGRTAAGSGTSASSTADPDADSRRSINSD